MATPSNLDEEDAYVIYLIRCILFLLVSIPPVLLLYKYIEYWNDDGPYQSTIGISWFVLNLITVSILMYAEFFGLKLKRRCTKLCYYFTTFTLCGLSDYLSGRLFMNLLPYHRKDISPYIHIFWILAAVLYNIMNIFNHMVLIYDTIIVSHQNRSLQVAKIRASFYVIVIISCIGNFSLVIYNPSVKLRELITANIILWTTITLGTSMLTLKVGDGDDMKQHKLINFFRRFSVFTNLKMGSIVIFINMVLTYSIPALIYNDKTNSVRDPKLKQKLYTYIPLMVWIFIFSFVRDACLLQRINKFWSRKDLVEKRNNRRVHIYATLSSSIEPKNLHRLRTIDERSTF